jgi:hypothetical protein
MGYRVRKGLTEKFFWLADGNRWTPIRKSASVGAAHSAAFYFAVLEVEEKCKSQTGGVEVA